MESKPAEICSSISDMSVFFRFARKNRTGKSDQLYFRRGLIAPIGSFSTTACLLPNAKLAIALDGKSSTAYFDGGNHKQREVVMTKFITLGMVSLCLLISALAGASQAPGRWELLGQREVDFRNDHDRINVGRSEGRFKQLQFRVKDAPIELSKMVVTFTNNQTFSPNIRHRFAEGSGTRVIDLPGDRRSIKRIDFKYKSINRREGKRTVEVLAR